jgi:microcystin-dependent protein
LAVAYQCDGSSTLNLPDLRGRQAIGYVSATTKYDTMGEKYGEDIVLVH